jgi:predicted nucleic acid-binding protein
MSYLLDTNVVSELTRPRPSKLVVRWLEAVPDEALHVSVLTVGEIRSGVERMAAGSRRERLRLWLEQDLPAWFEDRLLVLDAHIADRWGRLVASVRRPLPAIDGLIAATALGHGLRLVTRNTRDFADIPGLELVDPWAQPSRGTRGTPD